MLLAFTLGVAGVAVTICSNQNWSIFTVFFMRWSVRKVVTNIRVTHLKSKVKHHGCKGKYGLLGSLACMKTNAPLPANPGWDYSWPAPHWNRTNGGASCYSYILLIQSQVNPPKACLLPSDGSEIVSSVRLMDANGKPSIQKEQLRSLTHVRYCCWTANHSFLNESVFYLDAAAFWGSMFT